MASDKLIHMKKPIRNHEKLLMKRQLLKDGFSNREANEYIKEVEAEVRNSHEIEKKRIKEERRNFSKRLRRMKYG